MTTTSGWEKPKLIVLGRGTPEEQVLLGCKNSGGSGSPASNCVKGNSGKPCETIGSS